MLQIYDIDGLRELMEQFYILTGMRIVLFDEAHNEIASYPEKGIPFCSYMRLDADFDCKCRMSDKISFERCNQTNSLTIYKCHAGLIEATAPLTDNGNIIGYIMFGQIGDISDKNNFLDNLLKSSGYYDTEDVIRNAKKIKFKSGKQITAAAKILETCTNYILIKEMVKQPRIHLITKIDRYIDENLEENLTVDSICAKFGISRTRLYSMLKPYAKNGIAALIKSKRLIRAKELIESTEMSVNDISAIVGFDDYSYFLRVFKKEFGVSPKKLRQKY